MRVASWRVAMARSWVDTPVKPIIAPISTSRESPVFCWPTTAPASAARASVRYTPSLRRTWRSTLLLSASRIPRTFLPASVRPVYSKTGIRAGPAIRGPSPAVEGQAAQGATTTRSGPCAEEEQRRDAPAIGREATGVGWEDPPSLGHVLLRDAEDFRHAGHAADHLAGTVVHQRAHPVADRLPLDGPAVDVLQGELPEVIVQQHHLVDAGAPAVAGLVALIAAGRLVEHSAARLADRLRSEADLLQLLGRGQVRLAAILAEHAHQPLRQDPDERGGDQEGLDAHVHQAGDGPGGVVGVHGGEDQVAGERRLDGDLRRLQVADLADHDHVRVLAEEAAQAVRERQFDLRVHRGLRDSLQLVLDRILDGHDVEVGPVDLAQRRVERGGLAGAGRAGDEDDPVRPVDDRLHDAELLLVHPDLGEVEQHRALVEQTHHHPLAVDGGGGG